jgi:hypothetical protein
MKYKRRICFLTFSTIFLVSCNTNPFIADISKIEVAIEFINVDETFNNNLEAIENNHQKFAQLLGDIYLYELSMNLKTRDTSLFASGLKEFYGDEFIQSIEEEKMLIQAGIIKEQEKTTTAFRYLRAHFPEVLVPKKIVLMNKLFSGIKANDTIVTIAPENYINPQSKLVQSIPGDLIYQWQKDGMQVNHLSRDILLFWIQNQLFSEMDDYLAYHIIQAGKILYILNATFPDAPKHEILRYTAEQYQWAEENEFAFWEYLVREELLFQNNIRDKSNFLNEGPYTIGLPEKGPDRLGQFLGYKIVYGFMQQNKKLSLTDLIQTDYNTVLQSYQIK